MNIFCHLPRNGFEAILFMGEKGKTQEGSRELGEAEPRTGTKSLLKNLLEGPS